MKKLISFLILAVACFTTAWGQLHMPEIFSSNMVIQRQKAVNVWGTAKAGQKVTVAFNKQKVTAVADDNGAWKVVLKAMQANARPQTMTVKSGKDKITFDNVLVGEVWLAGGQSNMEYNMATIWRSGKGKKVVAPKHGENYQQKEMEKASCPLMRVLVVDKVRNTDTLPTDGWKVIDKKTLEPVSALGYFFGKNLIDSLNVPVGIITSCWGGSRIESWTPESAYVADSVLSKDTGSHKFHDGQAIGDMYCGMIRPIIPYTMRGFIWYQGESDLIAGLASLYPHMEEVMVKTWRNEWNDQQMPFYCVQLAPYTYSARRNDACQFTWTALPQFREKQTEALKLIPLSGMVTTTDLCDDVKDIHPTYKWEIGRRLAAVALNGCYGKKNIHHDGPRLAGIKTQKDNVILEFDRPLKTSDGKQPRCFTMSSGNNRFYEPTTITIDGNKVIMSCTRIKNPADVRFAWDEVYVTNLCDAQGWPAQQFEVKIRIK